MNTKYLEKASVTYYDGNPIMTDAEFDKVIVQLKKDNPDHPFLKRVGAPVPGTIKVKHAIPMGSLSNANNEKEFHAWMPDGNPMILLSHKLDGSSLELIYDNGYFVRAITRGDGIVGEDVTRNVLLSKNVPLRIHKSILSVRCECLIHILDWYEYFKGDANPRNSAAGTLRRHDGYNTKHLKFYAFDALINLDDATNEIEDANFCEFDLLDILSKWFYVPSYVSSNCWESIKSWCRSQESKRDSFKYEIDGIVVKIDDRAKSQAMGIKDGRPRGQVAVKFKPRGGETVLRKVVWQVGHTGALTPVGEVDPITVGGTVIKRVTLCNIDEITRLGIAIDDTVEIIRAGDVIPKLSKLIRKGGCRTIILPPDECPECKWTPFKDGAKLFCPNRKCPGQMLSRVMTWIKKRNILNIGSGLIVAANIKSISQLYEMKLNEWTDVIIGNGKLGTKRATKVMDSLEESKFVSLSDFIGSLGIKGVGRSLAANLCKHFSGLPDSQLTLEDILRLSETNIAGLENFGPIRATDFCDWLRQHRYEVEELANLVDIQYEENNKNMVFDCETICFTGKSPKTRPEMSKLAEDAGASVSSAVNSGTTILVINDINSMSVKAVKARKLGIRFMSPEDFFEKVT